MLTLEVGRSDAAEMAKQHGCIATCGKGATVPMGWKDAGCVNADLAGVAMVLFPPRPNNPPGAFLRTEMRLIERNSLTRRWSQGQQNMPIAICSITYALSVVFYSTLLYS